MSFRQKIEKYAQDNGYAIGTSEFHHNFMGQYIDAMAYSLYEWDKEYGTGGDLDWDYYRSMCFAGLSYVQKDSNDNPVLDSNGNPVRLDTDSFIELVPDESERELIKKIISDEAQGNSNSQGTDCE